MDIYNTKVVLVELQIYDNYNFHYFDKNDTLFVVDEPARVIERGEAVELEFREGMIGRLEKGYILPGQMEAIFSYKALIAHLNLCTTLLLSMMENKTSYFT